jgi:hypothetical protein
MRKSQFSPDMAALPKQSEGAQMLMGADKLGDFRYHQ